MTKYYWGGSNWSPDNVFPSGGKLYGIRQGFGSAVTTGVGLFSAVTAGNGTGASGNAEITNITDGNWMAWYTGTNNTFGRAGWWSYATGNSSTMRKFNPTFTTRFRLFQANTGGQGILYIGFVNQSAQPAAGTSMLNTYLDGKIGVLFGFRSTDTTFMIMSNNAQATSTYTTAGTPNSSAFDTNAHTLTIQITDNPAQINWWYDGTQMTSITNTTNNVPPSTTLIYPIMILEAQSATALYLVERWSQMYMDAI